MAVARAQGASSETNPIVVFDSPGVKAVSLRACNGDACVTVDRDVVVLDPRPQILSALGGLNLAGLLPGAPIVAQVGDLLRFAGTGDGKPALSFTWQVLEGTTVIAEIAGADVWWNTSGVGPGLYGVRLRLSNAAGEALSLPTLVTLVPSSDLSFFTVAPCRVYDSRSTSAPLPDGPAGRLVQLTGACGVPPSARAVVGNLTVVSPTGAGLLSARPGNYPTLTASNVAFGAGQTRAGFATLPLASDGTGTVAFSATVSGAGSLHFVLDVSGYFAPAGP